MTRFAMFNHSSALGRRSPSPPQYPKERKYKKPLMEKKRRARMNLCLEKLKELLLQSDLQQSSKLEKADVLEKTVAYMNNLQQENRRLHLQIQQILHSEHGQAYQTGLREGLSMCHSVTSEALLQMPLPPPFSTPDYRAALRHDIGDRLMGLLSRFPTSIGASHQSGSPNRMPNRPNGILPVFSNPLMPPFLGDPGKAFPQPNLAFPYPPPTFKVQGSHSSVNETTASQQPSKSTNKDEDREDLVDVESCDHQANNQSKSDDSGISSPPSDFHNSSPKAPSGREKSAKRQVWKPYENPRQLSEQKL